MEDTTDSISHEGKRYYFAHTEYVYQDEELNDVFGVLKLTQLVCASNMEKAKEAIQKQLEEEGKYLILKNRIDFPIVGS